MSENLNNSNPITSLDDHTEDADIANTAADDEFDAQIDQLISKHPTLKNKLEIFRSTSDKESPLHLLNLKMLILASDKDTYMLDYALLFVNEDTNQLIRHSIYCERDAATYEVYLRIFYTKYLKTNPDKMLCQRSSTELTDELRDDDWISPSTKAEFLEISLNLIDEINNDDGKNYHFESKELKANFLANHYSALFNAATHLLHFNVIFKTYNKVPNMQQTNRLDLNKVFQEENHALLEEQCKTICLLLNTPTNHDEGNHLIDIDLLNSLLYEEKEQHSTLAILKTLIKHDFDPHSAKEDSGVIQDKFTNFLTQICEEKKLFDSKDFIQLIEICEKKHLPDFTLIRELMGNDEFIYFCVKNGLLEPTKNLIENGLVDFKAHGDYLMPLAVLSDSENMVQLLIDNYADWKGSCNNDSNMGLDLMRAAIANCSLKMMAFLKKKGLDPKIYEESERPLNYDIIASAADQETKSKMLYLVGKQNTSPEFQEENYASFNENDLSLSKYFNGDLNAEVIDILKNQGFIEPDKFFLSTFSREKYDHLKIQKLSSPQQTPHNNIKQLNKSLSNIHTTLKKEYTSEITIKLLEAKSNLASFSHGIENNLALDDHQSSVDAKAINANNVFEVQNNLALDGLCCTKPVR